MIYNKIFKRLFDFLGAIFLLICFSPIILLLTLLLISANKGSAFFVQKRPGYRTATFKVLKFKTMNDAKDEKGKLLPDNLRLTNIGKFIRSSSLDELPQLINIIKGDMSFIGPRPLLIKYLPLYSKEQMKRHNVKPGLTGWAQVNGRNNITWKKKFELDVWYVDHISLKLDLKIILWTIKKVINKDGVSKDGHVTTVTFNGNN